MKAISILAAIVAAGGAWADDDGVNIGKYEFERSCAVCHGMDGKGGGPLAQHLTVRPPSLTTIRTSNDGVFPVSDVYQIIDGRADMALHGGRRMPFWGNRYRTDLLEDETSTYSADEAERYANVRILALIDYLASLQE